MCGRGREASVRSDPRAARLPLDGTTARRLGASSKDANAFLVVYIVQSTRSRCPCPAARASSGAVSSPRVIMSPHAARQLARRGIPEALAVQVASAPTQVLVVRPGRQIRQSVVSFLPGGRRYLLRAIVDVRGDDIRIVTVYRTSRVPKYWRDA